HPGLLNDSATTVLAGHATDGTLIAGAVARRSHHGVGISTAVARPDDLDTSLPMIPPAPHTPFPTHPPLRYVPTADLKATLHHGFEPLGALRIWLCGYVRRDVAQWYGPRASR